MIAIVWPVPSVFAGNLYSSATFRAVIDVGRAAGAAGAGAAAGADAGAGDNRLHHLRRCGAAVPGAAVPGVVVWGAAAAGCRATRKCARACGRLSSPSTA